jgi:hypothetical protein
LLSRRATDLGGVRRADGNQEQDIEVVSNLNELSNHDPGSRSCGDCTACCTVLAVDELRKPMRWACDHAACAGCRIYDARPQSCRDFNCQWLLGEISGDDSTRPDRVGVLFDCYQSTATRETRFVAFEVWEGAFDEPAGAALIARLAIDRDVQLSYRNGSWCTIENPKSNI